MQLKNNPSGRASASHEQERWRSVRTSYDTIAAEYAKRIYAELKDKPFDREWLDRFSERVRAIGQVCDLGCGPGHVARYLRDRGVDVFGLDLSPVMLEEARRLNPDIEFIEGTMMSLNMESERLAGIVALYSIIHMERNELGIAFAELWRVLRPGGCALVAFHVGSDTIHNTEWWGYSVNLDATFFTSGEIVEQLKRAGFEIEAAMERDPYPEVEYQSRRGYVVAIKDIPPAEGSRDE
jgi:SAM-dependent methyltransferase